MKSLYYKRRIYSLEYILEVKFKENLWCDKELEDKRKLRYYKEVVNPNLEYQKYIFVLTSVKKRINIAKIRNNFHELHSETGGCTIPKTPWKEIICHLCDTKRVEYAEHFCLGCPTYTQIRSQFQNVCHNTNLPNLISHQNYSNFGTCLVMFFKHQNNILKKSKSNGGGRCRLIT